MDLSLLIPALEAVVLERVGEGRFVRLSQRPRWWSACVDPAHDRDDGAALAIVDVFPFLAVFLPEAERAWRTPESLPVVSEMWTTSGSDGSDVHLEAVAKLVDGVAILVIVRNDQAFVERQLLLQRAREIKLVHAAFMREVERKEVLLHTIVHDLTAPLHSIIGALSLLREMALPPAALRWTQIAGDAAARQRQLVRGILEVFLSEQTKPPADHARVDLCKAVERAVEERDPVARQRQVELVRELEADCLLPVHADETRLLRVLTNLLDNALRYSPPGKRVTITTQRTHDAVRLTVDDEGPGVSRELMPLLFQKLAHDPRGGGTGFGLYFCRITVEQWGGGIGYEPRPGGGARFWIQLPLAPERPLAITDLDDQVRKVEHG